MTCTISKAVGFAFLCVVAFAAREQIEAQSKDSGKPKVIEKTHSLVAIERVKAKSEFASILYDSLKCDDEGNTYYFSDVTDAPTLRKLSHKGDRVAEFRPESNLDMPIDVAQDFTVTHSGEVLMLVFPHEISRYVFVYKPDGSYRSAIKLDPGFPWVPTTIAGFPAGGFLISGLEYAKGEKGDSIQAPFTGIFSSDAKLLKELKLEDDDDVYAMAQSGDPRFLAASGGNRAIEFTKMEAAEDGNVYLVRWTSPAIIYAISPGGEVVRRFTIDPGSAAHRPVSMHIAGGKIATLFVNNESTLDVIKVVDLQGRALATYIETVDQQKPANRLGDAFACYEDNPERFTFLSFGENNQLEIEVAEPR